MIVVNESNEKEQEIRKQERDFIIGRIKSQICFDALADEDGRCSNHMGKCYELGLLVRELENRS